MIMKKMIFNTMLIGILITTMACSKQNDIVKTTPEEIEHIPNVTQVEENNNQIYEFYNGLGTLRYSNDASIEFTNFKQITKADINAPDDWIFANQDIEAISFDVIDKQTKEVLMNLFVVKEGYLFNTNTLLENESIKIETIYDENKPIPNDIKATVFNNIQFSLENYTLNEEDILENLQSCAVITPIDKDYANVAILYALPKSFPLWSINDEALLDMIERSKTDIYTGKMKNSLFNSCGIQPEGLYGQYFYSDIVLNGNTVEHLQNIIENASVNIQVGNSESEDYLLLPILPINVSNVVINENVEFLNHDEADDFVELDFTLNSEGNRVYELVDTVYDFFTFEVPNDLKENITIGYTNRGKVFGIYYKGIGYEGETVMEPIYEYLIDHGFNAGTTCCASSWYTSYPVTDFTNGYRITMLEAISSDLANHEEYIEATEIRLDLNDKIVFVEK
ncbi:MAG: hypothetical protein RR658_01800 [Anaerorhabdus sp.]|uniref:hypothetical protein n=2 Tax=Anaerorhabdus sp. TaxID=1872524 RepID=UPI002FCAE3CC